MRQAWGTPRASFSLPRCPPAARGSVRCNENAGSHAGHEASPPTRRESRRASRSTDKAIPWRAICRARRSMRPYARSVAPPLHRSGSRARRDPPASAARRGDHACGWHPDPQYAADSDRRAHPPGAAPPMRPGHDRGATRRSAWEQSGSSPGSASSWVRGFHNDIAHAANALFGNA